jgi:hypothetical protein
MCPVAQGASADATCLARLCGCGWWLCRLLPDLGAQVPEKEALRLVSLSKGAMVKRKFAIKI